MLSGLLLAAAFGVRKRERRGQPDPSPEAAVLGPGTGTPSYDLSGSRLEPGQEADRVIEAFMPNLGYRRLHVEVPTGDHTAVAERNLH